MTDTGAKVPNRGNPTGSGGQAGSAGSPGTASTSPRATGESPGGTRLVTDMGKTQISEAVVAKVAGYAAREIPGVHSMGAGMARRMGQLRSLVPGGVDASRQGVSVEVGEREAAIDLDLVTYYGQNIVDVSEAVRRNVFDRVQTMTGLQVVEVNINVDDVYVEGEGNGQNGGEDQSQPRVQ